MKKVLVVSHAAVLEVNRAVYRELAAQGKIEVKLIAPVRWKGDLIRDLKCDSLHPSLNFEVISTRTCFTGNGSLYFFSPFWKKKLGDWRPDLVFVDEEPWSLSALQIYLNFGGKTEKTFFTKQNLLKKLPFPFSFIQNWIFARTPRAFSVASEVTRVLREKRFSGEIIELPHSYDPQLFRRRNADEIKEIRKELGIPDDKLVVSYFGRLTPEKGIEDLLTVQRQARSDPALKSCYFLWVGNGPLASRVRESVKAGTSDEASLLAAIRHDQVGRALSVSDILVLPSRTRKNWKEQFGRIIVEALAAGAAVIGSDSGEIPHLIDRTGGGLHFSEGKPDELLEAIRKLSTHPQLLAHFKEAGNDHVSRELTHHAVSAKLSAQLLDF